MSLVRQVKPGHEEVAYIHMGENSGETTTATTHNSDLSSPIPGTITNDGVTYQGTSISFTPHIPIISLAEAQEKMKPLPPISPSALDGNVHIGLGNDGNDLEKRLSKRTNELELDQQPSIETDIDGRDEEAQKGLTESYPRWKDENAVMVHDERPDVPEPSSNETIDFSLPELATTSSNATDEHEQLSLDSVVPTPSNKSVSAEDFERRMRRK
jgi:hypothetical protein